MFIGPPTINTPLIDQVKVFNTKTTLNCEASGGGTITYQWQELKNTSWMDISGSNNAEYETNGLKESSQFRCVASNEAGEATSSATILVLGKLL